MTGTNHLTRSLALAVAAAICVRPGYAQEGSTPRTDAYVAKVAAQSEAVVRRYIEALDRGDAPGAMRLIAPRLTLADHVHDCPPKSRGAACLRRITQGEIAGRQRFDISKLTVERDIVRVKAVLDSPSIEAKAGGPITVTDEFVVGGDRIVSFVRTPHSEDAATRRYYAGRGAN